MFQQERQEAKKLFTAENDPPPKAPVSPPAKTFTPGEIPSEDILEDTPQVEELPRKGPTPEQIVAIKVSHLGFNACFLSIFDYKFLFVELLFFNPPAERPVLQ